MLPLMSNTWGVSLTPEHNLFETCLDCTKITCFSIIYKNVYFLAEYLRIKISDIVYSYIMHTIVFLLSLYQV